MQWTLLPLLYWLLPPSRRSDSTTKLWERKKKKEQDVIPGKTSAIPGATDFALDPAATEASWLQSATDTERKVFQYTQQGLDSLKALKLEQAEANFDAVWALKPDAYVWQAGIVQFYLGHYDKAAEILARNAQWYESRFGDPASEERIWRHASELKYRSSMDKKKRSTLPRHLAAVPETDLTETRKVLRMARDLLEASVEDDYARMILAKAKLRAVCQVEPGKPALDRKLWKLSSWFYLGLHYDVVGEEEASKECMKMALRLCPSAGKSNDIVQTLPLLHMSVRDWFDDDELGEGGLPDTGFLESIESGVEDLRFVELQQALKLRGLPYTTGSKEVLKERLLQSLLRDVGLDDGSAP